MSTLAPAIFIMGPTAAGKTELALQLADKYPVELISVDSALVYRGMDIGTAKPDKAILAKYPHHLIDILDPADTYSVGDFRRDALTLMADITKRQKIPVLVGGTMLYFNALQRGLAELPEADLSIRKELDQLAAEKGLMYLHEQLQQCDPISAKRIHPNDPQRLQRALEIYRITGKSLTELTQTGQSSLPYRIVKVVLSPFERAVLHQRIATRYLDMMAAGFIDEVASFFQNPRYTANLPAMRSVGYRQVWQYLAGEYDKETCIEKAIIATRQMAKRQLTWLRKQQDGSWFDSGSDIPVEQITQFLSVNLAELNFKT